MSEPMQNRPDKDSSERLSAVEIVMMIASLGAIAVLTLMVLAAM